MTRELLVKYAIDPQRDVVLRAIEPTPARIGALMSGAVDAAVLNQLDSLIAKKNGYNELLFYGDHLSSSPPALPSPRKRWRSGRTSSSAFCAGLCADSGGSRPMKKRWSAG